VIRLLRRFIWEYRTHSEEERISYVCICKEGVATPRHMPAYPIVLAALAHLDPAMAAIIAPLPVYSPSSRYHRVSRPRSSSPSNFPSARDIFFPFSHWCGCSNGYAPSAPPSASLLVRLLQCQELYIQRATTAASIHSFDSTFVHSLLLQPPSQQHHVDQPLPERTPTPPGPAASFVDREPPLPLPRAVAAACPRSQSSPCTPTTWSSFSKSFWSCNAFSPFKG
jgi:hypothetical protein